MMEALFAMEVQRQAFLRMLAGGLALGAMIHAGQGLRRRRVLSALWDGACASVLLALLLRVFLLALGARGYALLGLALGLLLYAAGPGAVIAAAARKCAARSPAKEGIRPAGAEYTIHPSQAVPGGE